MSERTADQQLYHTNKLRWLKVYGGPTFDPYELVLQQWWVDPADPYGKGEWRNIEVVTDE